jgi:hypothetical protein
MDEVTSLVRLLGQFQRPQWWTPATRIFSRIQWLASSWRQSSTTGFLLCGQLCLTLAIPLTAHYSPEPLGSFLNHQLK